MPLSTDRMPVPDIEVAALFGVFSIDMLPLNTVDVSRELQAYINGSIITLPMDFNFAYNLAPHQRLYLQISANGRTWYIAHEQYHEDIVIDLSDTARRLIIVYYLYVNPNSNWRSIVSGQLLQLKSYGIMPDAELYVHVTDSHQHTAEVSAMVTALIPQAMINTSDINQFEYPGVKLVHELAGRYPDCDFMYFHSKGMSHGLHGRLPEDVALMTRTFESWRKHLQLLRKNGIEKVGLFPAMADSNQALPNGRKGGWIWYNYWMAKGRYLASCPEPELTDDRYYYEEWLGMRSGEPQPVIHHDCWSLYDIKQFNKTYFTSTEATYHLNRMMYKMGSNYIARRHPWLIKSSFTLQLLLNWKAFINKFSK
ncbi:hypothetical protein GCM10027037_33660 [Mucilaginibacter koreensis]